VRAFYVSLCPRPLTNPTRAHISLNKQRTQKHNLGTVRYVGTDGVINTYAGTGTAGYTGDGGLALAATFTYPYGLAWGRGGLYVADTGACERARVCAPPTFSATMQPTQPLSLAHTNTQNKQRITKGNYAARYVDPATNIITTFMGGLGTGYNGEGLAPAATQLGSVFRLSVSGQTLYVPDATNNRVRAV
jgi:hypothetical protein